MSKRCVDCRMAHVHVFYREDSGARRIRDGTQPNARDSHEWLQIPAIPLIDLNIQRAFSTSIRCKWLGQSRPISTI
jgi:hypothetical protein